MKRRKLWLISFIMLMGIAILGCSTKTIFAKKEKIKVGFMEQEGFSNINEDGTYSGICYEYLQLIADTCNWEYEFIVKDINELYDMLLNGEIDLMGGFLYDEGLVEYVNYPGYNSGVSYTTLTTYMEDDTLDSYDYSTLQGVTVGVYSNAKRARNDLEEFCKFNGIELNYRYYDDIYEYEDCLKNHEVDVKLSRDIESNPECPERIIARFMPRQYYFVSPKGKEDIIMALNQALRNIDLNYPDLDKRLYNKYFHYSLSQKMFLTNKEKEYIKNTDEIKVVLNGDVAPYHYYSSKAKKFRGITIDMLQLISEKTGLKFNLRNSKNSEEALELMESENASILAGATKQQCKLNGDNFIYTNGYVNANMVRVQSDKVSTADTKLVGAIPEYNKGIPNFDGETIVYYKTAEECIKAVEKNEVDYAYVSKYFSDYYYEENILKGVQILAGEEDNFQFYFALKSNQDMTLHNILNKVIDSLSEEEKTNLVYNNLIFADHDFDLHYFIAKNQSSILIIASVSTIMVLSISLYLLSRRQQRKLQESLYLQKIYENQTREALVAAQEANNAKTSFLSHMSHEIRTPLNGIIGMIKIALEEEIVSQKVKDCLYKMNISSKHLLSLINEILDMSSIENGKMKLESRIIDTKLFYCEIYEIIKTHSETKGICYKQNVSDKLEAYYLGDELRIKQVLMNLIYNAIKFTEKGGVVSFMADLAEKKEKYSYIRYIIEDTGIGMSEDFLKVVFNPFECEKNSSNIEGTGLGLPITKHIIELMGGNIVVESELEKGTKVTVVIRLENASRDVIRDTKEEKEEVIEEYNFEGYHILLVEDNEINREIEMFMLDKMNFTVDTAENGQEAVEKFMASEEGYYNVILMDIMMPIKNGLEATKEIREMKRRDALDVIIIAVSANAFNEDITKSFMSGMNAHISKPIEIKELYNKLCEFLIGK